MTEKRRIESVDVLRGLVMVLMALDHVRDFSHAVPYDPLDLNQASPLLFATRWITHFCAPAFVFLAGTGAFLSLSRTGDKGAAARFLITRGIWLILLERFVVNWAFNGEFLLDYCFLQVIWVLGVCMMLMAGIIFLPLRVIVGAGLAMVLGHNLLDGVSWDSALWTVLHVQRRITWDWQTIDLVYPVIPWIGVMMLGYGLGAVMKWPRPERVRFLWRTGLAAIALFLVLRGFNLYGNPGDWEALGGWRSVASFLDCRKYPPSLLFLCMTLGPSLLLLAFLDGRESWVTRRLLVFGQVPLFFYIIHGPFIHTLASAITYFRIGDWAWWYADMEARNLGLSGTYLMWAATVVVLYFPSVGWRALKRRHPRGLIRYL